MRLHIILFWEILILLSGLSIANAQISNRISSVTTEKPSEGQPLGIRVELAQAIRFDRIILAYRSFGQSEYKELEMAVANNVATTSIPGRDVVPPSIEYYVSLQIHNQPQSETYPIENPREHPLRITFSATGEKESEIIILSPDKGEEVAVEDFFVSASLLRATNVVDRKATRIYLDDVDVTQYSLMSDDLILLHGENIPTGVRPGTRSIRFELYDKDGNLYTTAQTTVKVRSTASLETERSVEYRASVQLESRNENVSSKSDSYNRGTINTAANYGEFTARGKMYVSNEEKSYRQPQNRYFVGLESPWIKVGYGDAYPTFPRLIMDGKRLRGMHGNLALGFFNLDLAWGEITRKVESDTIKTFPETDTTSFRDPTKSIAPYDTTGGRRRWAWWNLGTFSRNLFVLRPSFGKGEKFQFGLTYLKSKDDVGSIRYGIRPQENLVLGSDLFLGFDDRRIEFTGQAALSISNKDISRGSISDSTINRLFSDNQDSTSRRNQLRDLRDLVSSIITVNENLVPLSVENLTTLAYEGALTLNYFNNYFKFGYIRRGHSYESFGQSYNRTDVSGFTINDRLRLLQNQMLLTVGFERLEDNLGKTKPSTTVFSTYNGTATYLPRFRFPIITVGLSVNSNANGLHRDSLNSISDEAFRTFLQLGYDFGSGIRHNANAAFSFSSRDDQTVRDADTRNTTIGFSLTTLFRIPLQTTAGLMINLNSYSYTRPGRAAATTEADYTTLILNARYRMLNEKLRIGSTISPTFGSIQRWMFDVTGDYQLSKNLGAGIQSSFYASPTATPDLVFALNLRYDI